MLRQTGNCLKKQWRSMGLNCLKQNGGIIVGPILKNMKCLIWILQREKNILSNKKKIVAIFLVPTFVSIASLLRRTSFIVLLSIKQISLELPASFLFLQR